MSPVAISTRLPGGPAVGRSSYLNDAPRLAVVAVVMILLLVAAVPLPASASTERPKIGLALSGGGTKAGAHIGVLRVLEAQRVPVDYIAGTSAGAIVGGLYAAGLSPDDIEAAIAQIDWDDIVRDAPPRTDLPFRRKRDDLNYLVKARPGFSDAQLKLPMGLIQGQKITHFLRRHLDYAPAGGDFGALPIPFRAVTTDLATGEMVVIERGDLALAIRASMSVPVFFAPVTIDGRQLIDGGTANNLPIDVVRQMGADIVIAVDITAPLLGPEQLDSVLSVTDQLTNFLTRQNVQQRLATLSARDILIRPELDQVSAIDLEKTLTTVEPGALAAQAVQDRLAVLSLGHAGYQAHLAVRAPPATTNRSLIDFVEVTNTSRISTETIRYRLGFAAGDAIDRGRIERGIANVYGLDVFERIDYRIVEREGQTGVLIDAVPKPWGPNYLQFGLRLSEDFSTGSNFDLGVAYLRTAVNDKGGEWRAQLDLGERQGLSVNWFQPLSYYSRHFAEAGLRVQRRNFRIFDQGDPIADLRVSGWGGGLAVGTEVGTSGEFRVGWNRFTGDADINVGTFDLSDDDVDTGEFFASAFYDRLDNANFPHSGVSALGAVAWSGKTAGADSSFEQVFGSYLVADSWGENTAFLNLELGTTLDEDAPLQSQFLLGGLGRLSGHPNTRFSGQHYALANLTAYRRVRASSWLPLYAGFSVETGNVWNDRDDISTDSLQFAGALYAGADTPIGPLYLAWGLAEGGHSTTYLYLGNPFGSRRARPLD